MNILIVGGGGREHALAWKLKQSLRTEKIFVAPGNAGTGRIATNVSLDLKNHQDVIEWLRENKVDLVVIGPDDSLADGIVDSLTGAGIKTFGPKKSAAEIEWSKSFAKSFMREEGIPTAAYQVFHDSKSGKAYIANQKFPIVIKASGLALGKGVVIANTLKEAEQAIDDILVHKIFGRAGDEIIVEEYLEGQEISIHAFCDGETAVLFPPSQDHKRIFDGDEGPNTGGMGTTAPVPWVSKALMEEIRESIVSPTLKGLKKRGREFIGVLYPGLMITKEGLKVLEFNARFGDPETQSYMRLLETDLLDIMFTCIEGRLATQKIEWGSRSACCIVAASAGYPGEYKKGFIVSGLENSESDDSVVFQAGTRCEDGRTLTNGGRVLGVTAVGADTHSALEKAYATMAKIHFEGMYYRNDIGQNYERVL